MSVRNHVILLLLFAVVGLAAVFAASSKSLPPVTVSIVNVVEMGETKIVTMEFQRRAAARFAEAHHVQIRVAGRWQPPVILPRFQDGYLLARTDSQRLIFDFPSQTEACRFLLGYRVGPRTYCQASFFLSKHGVSQKFPKLSRALLKCVPQQPKLRRVDSQLEIPKGDT